MKFERTIFCTLLLELLGVCLTGQTIGTPQIRWEFESGASIRGTALLDRGRLYFGNSNGTFHCLRADNAELVWTYECRSTITSQPVVTGDRVLVSSRGNRLYSFRKDDGSLEWSFALDEASPHRYGWDYHDASPVVLGETVIISSGENRLFALNLANGEHLWTFEADDLLRATPLYREGVLYVPCYNGVLYSLRAEDGELLGRLETDGVSFYSTVNGWDRTALMARPALGKGMLLVGSRDGGLYGFDAESLEQRWRSTYGMTWVAGSPVIDGDRVYVGWSDNHLVTAMDLETGDEVWNFKTAGIVFSDPVLDDENLHVGSYDGNLYCLQKDTGELVWNYPTGSPITSSPILGEGVVYVGNDNGSLFAFEDAKAIKAVYQVDDDRLPRNMLVSDRIAPFLEARSFRRLDASNLGSFLSDRIDDRKPSVVVFAHVYFPEGIVDPASGRDLFREYMESGGRVIWMHVSPNKFAFDENRKVIGRSDDYAEALWDVEFDILSDWASYYSKATEEGIRWGLPESSMMKGVLFPKTPGIVPLATTELGRIAAFHKHFGGPANSGFVFLRSWDKVLSQRDLEVILSLADYEL